MTSVLRLLGYLPFAVRRVRIVPGMPRKLPGTGFHVAHERYAHQHPAFHAASKAFPLPSDRVPIYICVMRECVFLEEFPWRVRGPRLSKLSLKRASNIKSPGYPASRQSSELALCLRELTSNRARERIKLDVSMRLDEGRTQDDA